MSRNYYWVAIIILLWSPLSLADPVADCEPWTAKIASVQGKVEAKRARAEEWVSVELNQYYCAGDQIQVAANSRASLILANETVVRLDQNSVIILSEIDQDKLSFLDLIKGIAHFISRVPHSLKVNTPFVNAAIEGTEFVIEVNEQEANVTVFEGTVLAENEQGQLRLTNNESANVLAGKAPQKVLLAKPRDTVQWALYFPPIFANTSDPLLQQASQRLYQGRVNEAQQLLAKVEQTNQAQRGSVKALRAIIAVVNNRPEQALNLAQQAVRDAPNIAATHMALSYAWQATLRLDKALASAQHAVNADANNALAWARLAELQLSFDQLSPALTATQRAYELDPKLSRTQTIRGFAYLIQLNTARARHTFQQAIKLDQADPLPRLGLGLAQIHDNQLAKGRRNIEIAASLDPNNAIIRSYLGKAYFEEKRAPLDADQFAMAKNLDPNDPTPWFYDALRKQTENRPVEALRDLNQSIALNDNRAVYRSSLQLDQDEATRNANLATIYEELGFEQAGLNEATKSLMQNPANHSAHRFLSNVYANKNRYEIAQVSEALQSKMLQDINNHPVLPQMNETGLNLANSFNHSLGHNEYGSLFTRDQSHISATGVVGTNNLVADQLSAYGSYNGFSYSLGQFSYNTDGFEAGRDINHDISNAFMQYYINKQWNVQVESQSRRTQQGNVATSLMPSSLANEQLSLDEKTHRLGLRYHPSTHSVLLLSIIDKERIGIVASNTPSSSTNAYEKDESRDIQLHYIHETENNNLVIGASNTDIDSILQLQVRQNGSMVLDNNTFPKDKQNIFYAYNNSNITEQIMLTLGLSYFDVTSPDNTNGVDELNPKLGLTWQVSPVTTLRLAAYKNIKRMLTTNQTLEPTHVAGFNQFFDENNLTESKSYGFGLDHQLSANIQMGIELLARQLDVPQQQSNSSTPNVFFTTFQAQNERYHSTYINWLISNRWQLNARYELEQYRNSTLPLRELDSHKLPLTLQYFSPSGLFSSLRYIYVDQKGVFTNSTERSDFGVVDLGIGYRFPKRQGAISLHIHNLFDKSFLYESHDIYNADKFNHQLDLVPEQTIQFQATLQF